MIDINTIANNGFSWTGRRGELTGLALLSLRIALRAFFSTYQSMRYSLHLFDARSSEDQETIDFNHSPSYCEACAESIVHFQHFVELICKDFLRADHPLLADDASTRPVILHKLLKGEPVSSADQERLKSLGFWEALERLCALINEGRIGSDQLDFIVQARPWLENLNRLRNRLWHRGTFILRYPALDEFVGEYVLPFARNVVALPEYSGHQRLWRYRDLTCGIDPIEDIISAFRTGQPDLGKVALLKELGRAAYENPLLSLPITDLFNREHRRRVERIAAAEIHEPSGAGVRTCPVCGVRSLIVYDDIEPEGYDPAEGTYERAWRYTWQVKCMCCTFEINHHLENPSVYGLPIEDYWHAEEL